MNKIILSFLCLALVGCATVIPDYIEPRYPYARKVYGDYGAIMACVKRVLAAEGWAVRKEADPSTYERGNDTKANEDKSVLLFTDVKQHSRFLYSSYTHLNVFIRPLAGGAEVEMRYACQTPLFVKQLKGARNDRLVNRLLDAVEHQMEK